MAKPNHLLLARNNIRVMLSDNHAARKSMHTLTHFIVFMHAMFWKPPDLDEASKQLFKVSSFSSTAFSEGSICDVD